jgi:hypothetical protein
LALEEIYTLKIAAEYFIGKHFSQIFSEANKQSPQKTFQKVLEIQMTFSRRKVKRLTKINKIK